MLMNIKNKSDIEKLCGIINKACKITLTVHARPDGDAIGSSIGFMHYLTELKSKDAKLVIADPVPDNISFIVPETDSGNVLTYSHAQDKQEIADRIKSSDLIFCLDFNNLSRTSDLEPMFTESTAEKILIDHHPEPDLSVFDESFSMIEVSSTAELIFHILMAMPEIGNDASKLPEISAAALLTGMTTDTNNFANSVFPSTLDMASALLEAGVDRDGILAMLYNRYRENRIRLLGFLLDKKLVITRKGAAYMVIDKKTADKYDIREGETEGFVNIPLAIEDVCMSILLKEDNGFFRVSIRSKKGISANECAKRFFNGGGHENAAGGKLYIQTDIKKKADAGDYIKKSTDIFLTQDI